MEQYCMLTMSEGESSTSNEASDEIPVGGILIIAFISARPEFFCSTFLTLAFTISPIGPWTFSSLFTASSTTLKLSTKVKSRVSIS